MPRAGYQDFVDLFQANVLSSFRVVHFQDIVPHYPLRFQQGIVEHVLPPYHHVAMELWEPYEVFTGTLQHCYMGAGEDPRCSNSVKPWRWNPDDHMTYLGIPNDNCRPESLFIKR